MTAQTLQSEKSVPADEALTEEDIRRGVTFNPATDVPVRITGATVRRWVPFLVVILVTTLLNAGVTYLFVTWKTPVVVAFDMKGTVDQFTAQVTEQTLDEAGLKALTGRFMASLSGTLEDWQRRNNALILVSPAVVGGAEDITPAIQREVADTMRETK